MSRALVTGSAGFLGRHFVQALERDDWDVERCDPRHDVLEGKWDARVLPQLRHSSSYTPYDLVIHAAAMVDGREAIEGKAALLGAYNLQLDGALFEWALRAEPGRIVYFSSSAAYPVWAQSGIGPNGSAPLTEGHCEFGDFHSGTPDATYGWVKLTGERIANEVRNAGIPVTVVRPFSGYGEDQDDCYPFPAMMARARRRDDPFVVWGDGKQVRDFVHVDDIVGAILALVENEVDGPVNIGTGIGTSMDDLARLAMKTAGYEAPIKHLSDKPSGVRYRVADTQLLRKYYTPKITLEEGVRRALA